MLMYKRIGKERWDNAYKWTTDEFIEFLSMFPTGTPIATDLYLYTKADSDCTLDDCEKFTTKDGTCFIPIPQKGNVQLYIQEGTLPIDTLEDMNDGKAKNLIKIAYDMVDMKKFLGMVFDIIAEDE